MADVNTCVKMLEASGSLGGTDKYAVVGGNIALDGSNPTNITTGLTTILGAAAGLEGSSAPGDNTSVITVTVSGGTLALYAWKNTGGTDPTLVASTGTENVWYVAFGIK